jgi:hypothetical protein
MIRTIALTFVVLLPWAIAGGVGFLCGGYAGFAADPDAWGVLIGPAIVTMAFLYCWACGSLENRD